MARESKGTKVRTFTVYVPQMDLTKSKEVWPIYLDSDGQFVVYVADHIAEIVGTWSDQPQGWRKPRVTSSELERVKWATETVLRRAENVLIEGAKEKVILVTFKANRLGEGKYEHRDRFKPSAISFADSPTVHLTYRVLWKSGAGLFRQDRPDSPLTYITSATSGTNRLPDRLPETLQIPWTQEREDFFERTVQALGALIDRVAVFLGSEDLAGALDVAIAGGGEIPALPAPQPKEGPSDGR